MAAHDKPLVWLQSEVKSPPFSDVARRDVGVLLRRSQRSERLEMPASRPMHVLGHACHELRVRDAVTRRQWRLIYRIDPDAIVVLEVFHKTTRQTPKQVLDTCRRRMAQYDRLSKGSD